MLSITENPRFLSHRSVAAENPRPPTVASSRWNNYTNNHDKLRMYLHIPSLFTASLTTCQGFWYGNFSIGGTSNLNLMIDTGSGDVVLNPGLYVPGKASKNLNLTFENTYGTTSSNGTGNAAVCASATHEPSNNMLTPNSHRCQGSFTPTRSHTVD